MDEPERTEWQIRCAFNGFCKRTLKNESINAHKELKKRQAHEINFSDLTPKEENQLYACEDFFTEDKEEQTFFAGGKELSAKLIADAIHSLPEEKRRAVLLYYFFDMSDAEIAALYQIPRSTVQYRRTSSFELLKRYLEEHVALHSHTNMVLTAKITLVVLPPPAGIHILLPPPGLALAPGLFTSPDPLVLPAAAQL